MVLHFLSHSWGIILHHQQAKREVEITLLPIRIRVKRQWPTKQALVLTVNSPMSKCVSAHGIYRYTQFPRFQPQREMRAREIHTQQSFHAIPTSNFPGFLQKVPGPACSWLDPGRKTSWPRGYNMPVPAYVDD